MPAFVALLRGINVGRAKRVPMADLRDLLEGLGLGGVRTLLNSGNALFTAKGGAADLARTLAAALEARFGFAVPVVVRTAESLRAAVAECPFKDTVADPSRCLVIFWQGDKPPAGLDRVAAAVAAGDRFAVGRHAAYLDCPGGILESPAATQALGGLKAAVTTRNWATVLKLVEDSV